ncbi:MAG: non-canonical purine NTP pyrophosphatase [Candidatus Levybacteria bacterium]|nr:non-canonical purine NTP pyrophosphatase [Candidatus Levybacteria bacterium]
MRKRRLLIATKNKGKFSEIKNFLSDLPLKLVSLSDINITQGLEETGKTYKQNSQKKALFYSKLSGLPTIADDGGIEISALGGEPGIHSRRWLGHEASDQELLGHMLKVSKELPDSNRKAFFKTVISFALPNGKVWSVKGEVEGIIVSQPHQKLIKGYPYRSFFYLPKIKKFYHESELTNDEQKIYNHRYKAIQKLKLIIKNELGIRN